MIALAVAPEHRVSWERALARQGIEVGASSEVLLAEPSRLAEVDLAGVRWVQSTWAGVDAIDFTTFPADIVLTGLPGVFGPQMAEFVLAHLLARTQRVVERHATHSWDATPPRALKGSRMGVLGAGSIGRAIARAASAFGVDVVGCRWSAVADPAFLRIYGPDEADAFASGLDHLVVVLPSTPHTDRLVDRAMLSLLAPGANLVNVGRGATVDLDAVIEALSTGTLGLAVLDVTDPEPLPSDHPAWSTPNLVITGHTAAVSRPDDVVSFFAANLERYRSGAPLEGVVDPGRGY